MASPNPVPASAFCSGVGDNEVTHDREGTLMSTRRLALATLPLAAALIATMAPAATATTTEVAATPPDSDSLLFGFHDAFRGSVAGTPGNRHHLYLLDGEGPATGYLRSYTCPEDAPFTDAWASQRCTHLLTQDLRPQWGNPPTAWISSTGRSGVFRTDKLVGTNRATGYRRAVSADLTFVAGKTAEPLGADGHYAWSTADARGNLGGATVWITGNAWFGWTG